MQRRWDDLEPIFSGNEGAAAATGLLQKLSLGGNFAFSLSHAYYGGKISFNIYFGCLKELSHWDGSFDYPQHMYWWEIKITHSWVIHYAENNSPFNYTVVGLSRLCCIVLKSCFTCKPFRFYRVVAIMDYSRIRFEKGSKEYCTENYGCVFPAGNQTWVKSLDSQAMITLPHLYLVKYALRYMLLH